MFGFNIHKVATLNESFHKFVTFMFVYVVLYLNWFSLWFENALISSAFLLRHYLLNCSYFTNAVLWLLTKNKGLEAF